MATRFGASSSSTHITRTRWVIGFMGSTILILICTIAVMVNTDSTTKDENNLINQAEASTPTMASVLVARERIEAGSEIQSFMLSENLVAIDAVPRGVVLANDRLAIINTFAQKLINPGEYLHFEDTSRERQREINIPDGYRAISIVLDSAARVGPLVKPQSRVDINWYRTNKQGHGTSCPLVYSTKVIAIGNETESDSKNLSHNGSVVVTLLVTEAEAREIDVAQRIGSLSLALTGNTSTPKVIDPATKCDFGVTKPEKARTLGTMTYTDPITGEKTVVKLNENEEWIESSTADEKN